MTLKKGFLFKLEEQRFNSLFFRNFCTSILISVLLTSIFGGYIYYTDSRTFRNEIHNKRAESLTYVKNVIDDTVMRMDKIAINTKMQASVEKFILNGTADPELVERMKEYVNNYMAIYHYIDSVYIYAEKTGQIFARESNMPDLQAVDKFSDLQWYERYKAMDGKSVDIFERQKDESGSYLITIVRPVSFNRKDKLGAVVINLNVMKLSDTLRYDNTNQNIFLISENGNIILSQDKTLVFKNVNDSEDYASLGRSEENGTGSGKIKGEDVYITIVNSAYNGWRYVIYDYQNEYDVEWTRFFGKFLQVCIIFFGISLLVTYLLTMRNYKPLKKIMTFIDKTNDEKDGEGKQQKGNYYANKLAEMVLSNRRDEDEEIIHQFIGYNKAQIMVLHSQIKAHFLYNMLSTIQWKAFEMTETENDVSVMIYKLGEFFKTCMEINASVVRIEEEIANARLYVELMQFRFEDVFCVDWEIDEDVYDYKTINICLQPIIENAIEHGLRHRENKGMLIVRMQQHKDMVQFVVEDDGVGMTSEKVSELNRMLVDGGEYNSEHVGLMNVSKRLNFMFGSKSSVKVESKPGQGTKVIIRFPGIM